ncbi:MAG: TauD/TfdA family dioxygenase [Gammaproteobacteria bacterium]|nr:TauD/TfdA family dioxygenase [Gammaproteobacteria bacterium]MBQ0838179.1 TauD/TfdA family dioxygenase [Gammaproteobacteria bacterium]
MNTHFEVEPLTPFIGSEIKGLDLSQPIPADTLAELRKVWLDRKMIYFLDQKLTPDQQLAFTRQFGEVNKYPFLNGIEGNPLVAPVLKLPEETINFGGVWHADTTYLESPAAGASLYALELPPVGGDTIFCNMQTAYEALEQGIKELIDGRKAVFTSGKAAVSKTRMPRLADCGDSSAPEVFTNIHPVVRTHPETGEKTLFVHEAHTLSFEHCSEEESEPLLHQLYMHARKPEFQCRLRWSPGMVVLWDNRSSHHYPINDYNGYRRLLHRVSLKGDRPV